MTLSAEGVEGFELVTQSELCSDLHLKVGDFIKLTAGESRVVDSMPPDQVMWHLNAGNSFRDIMSFTMVWRHVTRDCGGFVTTVLSDPASAFRMYFVLIDGTPVTLYGFYDGIKRLGSIDGMHLADGG